MSYYSKEELKNINFGSIGNNVKISRRSCFYGSENIHIGDNVRIDDFCVISAGSAGIYIGNFVHIAGFCSLIGAEKITLSDFSGLSSRVSIYSSSDDYSGLYLTNPTVSTKYKNVFNSPVFLGRHVIVGSGSVILPGVIVGEGAAIGGLSLINKSINEFTIWSGVPARFIKNRSNNILALEREFLGSQ